MNGKKLLMIVDDDADDREFFCDAVKEIDLSIKYIVAVNGVEALEKVRHDCKQLPDLIFLDLNMPKMDGRTCLAELKKDEQLKHIPVIIFSTSSSSKEVEETHELGAVYFLTKPTDFKKLQSEIVFVMNKNWALQAKVIPD